GACPFLDALVPARPDRAAGRPARAPASPESPVSVGAQTALGPGSRRAPSAALADTPAGRTPAAEAAATGRQVVDTWGRAASAGSCRGGQALEPGMRTARRERAPEPPKLSWPASKAAAAAEARSAGRQRYSGPSLAESAESRSAGLTGSCRLFAVPSRDYARTCAHP